MLLVAIPGLQQILLRFLSEASKIFLFYFPLVFLSEFRPNLYQPFAEDYDLSSRIFPLPNTSILEEGPSRQLPLSNDQKRNDMILIPLIPFSVNNKFSIKPEVPGQRAPK